MRLIKPVLFSSIFAFLTFSVFAQADSVLSKNDNSQNKKLNFIKLNLTAFVLKNYSFQYEKAVSRKISLGSSFRIMPSGSIPLQNTVLKIVDKNNADEETRNAIESLRMSNIAITPEAKLYLSNRGYGRGFYISLFYRYAKFNVDNVLFNVESAPGVTREISFSGSLSANTGGLLFGAQWPIGKSFCLDLWLIGPHIGSGNGLIDATPSTPLTTFEQNELRRTLEDLEIPLTRKTVTVSANAASLKLDGPWGGIRSGLSFGVRF